MGGLRNDIQRSNKAELHLRLAILIIASYAVLCFAAEETAKKPALYATGFSVLPLIAIVLALITKYTVPCSSAFQVRYCMPVPTSAAS